MVANFPDEILLEILIRLPNCKSIISCRSVCKRWLSLMTQQSTLFQRRISELNQPQSYTHLIEQHTTPKGCPAEILWSEYHEFSFVRRSELQITTISKTRLDFLPWPQEELQIRDSFGDLLLVSPRNNNREYCICNFFTKQTVRLPRAPINYMVESALVLESKSCNKRLRCNCDVRYKVVLIQERSRRAVRRGSGSGLRVTVFCSETGCWTKTRVVDSWDSEPKLNGCWVGLVGKFLLTFHPLERPGKQIASTSMPDVIFSRKLFNSNTTAIIGSFKGRLRLAEMTWDLEESRHLLKIWDQNLLGHWDLLHDIELKPRGDHGTAKMSIYSCHPDDENLVFMRCAENDNICIYDIAEGSLQQVGGIPKLRRHFIDSVNHFDFFILQCLSTPTVIPSLPN